MGYENGVQSIDAGATDTLTAQIDELLDVSSTDDVSGDLSVDAPSGEAPIVDGVTEGGDQGEIVVPGDVIVETPSNVDNTPSEIEQLKAQIESLQGIVTQLSSPKEEVQKHELIPDLDTLINGVDFDEIMESKEKFMGFIKDAFQVMTQSTTGYVQNVVPDVVSRQVTMQELRENFYRDNKDLNAVRPYVAMIAGNVAKENPDLGIADVLNKAAEVARESLGIVKVPTKMETSSVTPVLPGSKGVRTPMQQKSKLQSEIDELMED